MENAPRSEGVPEHGLSRQMIELSPAKARAVARFGEQCIRAGDHISYFQPLFVSGKKTTSNEDKMRYTQVLRVDPTDEYPLRISTEELLDLHAKVRWESDTEGRSTETKQNLRKLYSFTFIPSEIDAPTLREQIGAELRAIQESALFDVVGQTRTANCTETLTPFDLVPETSDSDNSNDSKGDTGECDPDERDTEVRLTKRILVGSCNTSGELVDQGEPRNSAVDCAETVASSGSLRCVQEVPGLPSQLVVNAETHNTMCHYHLEPPPQATYASLDSAIEAANKFARNYGYGLINRRSWTNSKDERRRVLLVCDRHGVRDTRYTPRPGSIRRPNVSTRKCNCPMKVNLYVVKGTNKWEIRHSGQDGLASRLHNHEASTDSGSHPVHRRLDMTADVKARIKTDLDVGIQPKQSLAIILAQNPESSIRPRDIANERGRVRKSGLNGMTPMNSLLHQLSKPDYIHAVKLDSMKQVTHLFFTYRPVVDIFRANPDVILMDCTYKTNVFEIPLLNIVGLSGMNTTVHLAQVFMVKEKFPDYQWALRQLRILLETNDIEFPQFCMTDLDLALVNAVENVFPDTPALLCIWHIKTNVKDHARKNAFKPIRVISSDGSEVEVENEGLDIFCDAFDDVLRAPTVELYEERRNRLTQLSVSEAQYVNKTWLDLWDKRMVRCWTNKITHFGLQATSRVEGYHAALKHWILDSNGDFLKVYNVMTHWWRQSIREHNARVSDEKIRTVTNLANLPLFANVLQKIHNYALMLCFNMSNVALTFEDNCSGVYRHTTGLPCRHTLKQIADQGKSLDINHFHVHWWISRTQPAPLPAVVERDKIAARRAKANKKRRMAKSHKKGNGVNSTRRDPSFHELQTSQHQRSRQQRSGNHSTNLPEHVTMQSESLLLTSDSQASYGRHRRRANAGDVSVDAVMACADKPPVTAVYEADIQLSADRNMNTRSSGVNRARRQIASPTNQWWLQ